MKYNGKVVQSDLAELLNINLDFEKIKGKTVLITGATGMLATYLIYFLMYLNDERDAGITIYGLVRNINKFEEKFLYNNRKDLIPIVQDVCDDIDIDSNIDYIIHMASSANPKTIISDPVGIIKSNVFGTFNVLNLAQRKNSEVIFTSTREVYGKVSDDIKYIKEDDMGALNCFEQRACYPESKRIAETILYNYHVQYGVKFKNLRIAHSYGPGMNIDNDGRIMSDLISDVVNNRNIVLKSSGIDKRAFCYITDAISAIMYILLNGENAQSYNIANEEEEISIKELAEMLSKEYNLNIEYQLNEKNKNAYTNFKRVGLDTKKLEELGWKPQITLKEGITRTIDSFK